MGGVCESAASKVRRSAHSAYHDRYAKNLGWIFREVWKCEVYVYHCFLKKKGEKTLRRLSQGLVEAL